VLKKLKHLFLGAEDTGTDNGQRAEPQDSGASGESRRRHLIMLFACLAAGAAAFLAGYLIADDSGEVSRLKDQVAEVESDLEGAEGEAGGYADEVDVLEESTESLEGKLHAERSLNGKIEVPQNTEFETDFDWEAAGKRPEPSAISR